MIRRLLLIAALLTASEVRAQAPLPVLSSTDLVRVKTEQGQKHVGRVLYSSADSVILTGYNTAIELGSADVRRIDLGTGQTPWRKAEAGGMIGLAVGTAVGLYWVIDLNSGGGSDPLGITSMLSPLLVCIVAVDGMAIGYAVGLVVGLFNPSERWERVYPRPSRMDIIFGNPRAPGLGLRLTF